jgi:hypothetical protein
MKMKQELIQLNNASNLVSTSNSSSSQGEDLLQNFQE